MSGQKMQDWNNFKQGLIFPFTNIYIVTVQNLKDFSTDSHLIKIGMAIMAITL